MTWLVAAVLVFWLVVCPFIWSCEVMLRPRSAAGSTGQTKKAERGAAWVEDSPWPECFEEDL